MLAVPVDEPFENEDWVYEVKWDGVRAILFWNKSDAILKITSRKGNEISQRYPEIMTAIDSYIHCNNSVVLDGEIVVLDKEDVPDFQRHQSRMNVDDKRQIEKLSTQSPATYYVFDILYLDGMNLEQLDFVERRRILSSAVIKEIPQGKIRISGYMEGNGRAIFQSAISMKLEGIVAKNKHSKYQQRVRSPAWLKIKGVITQDCVVVGYTKGEGNREGLFGSLILAANVSGKLKFIGHTGSGFGLAQLVDTLKTMQSFRTDKRPLNNVPYVNREPVWLRPELVVEVKFHGWTQQGIMRAPIFIRFIDDKTAKECIIETPKDTDKIVHDKISSENEIKTDNASEQALKDTFSNLDKVYWPSSSYTGNKALTKQDLIDYYDDVSQYILPHLKDRPLSLSRHPNGINGRSFFHKNWEHLGPDYVKTIQIFSESSDRIINYIVCNNRETLLWLANLGCIEMHPWYSRVQSYSACREIAATAAKPGDIPGSDLHEGKCGLVTPDFIVFDLDPYIYSGKERKDQEPEYNIKGFKSAVEVALALKSFLDGFDIKAFVKTSGKTGLHIFIPIVQTYTYEQTRAFAEAAGKILMTRENDKITMQWSTEKRIGRVFFDYNQNAMGKTLASIFSVRPTNSATVSMPIEWRKLEQTLPTDYTMLNLPGILKNRGDPWANIYQSKQDLAKLVEKRGSEVA
jgi:bifunctional non-homologous end joining protein LigD